MRTPEGKVVLFDLETGEQREFWPIDASALVAAGTHSAEAPEGVVPKPPVELPRNVGAPKVVVADNPPEAPPEEPEDAPEAPKKKARKPRKKG